MAKLYTAEALPAGVCLNIAISHGIVENTAIIAWSRFGIPRIAKCMKPVSPQRTARLSISSTSRWRATWPKQAASSRAFMPQSRTRISPSLNVSPSWIDVGTPPISRAGSAACAIVVKYSVSVLDFVHRVMKKSFPFMSDNVFSEK